MVRKVCHQPPENEVLGSGVQRGSHEDEDVLRDVHADVLRLIDGDAAADEAGDPDLGLSAISGERDAHPSY